MGCCKSSEPDSPPEEELSMKAGNKLGYALLEKGKEKADQTGTKLLDCVESRFDDRMDKMINKKLLEKCDTVFDKAVDDFIDKTFERAMEKFKTEYNEDKYDDNNDDNDGHDDHDKLLRWDKQKKKNATTKLKHWGLPQMLIDTMDEEGWLIEHNWDVLTKDELKRMNFGNGHIESFMNGMRHKKQLQEEQSDERRRSLRYKRKKNKDSNAPSDILAEWGIPSNLIDKMNEVGWNHPQYWNDLLEQDGELETLGFSSGHISTFKRKFQHWKEDQDSKATERKIQLLRKLDKAQQKQSSILKRNIDVENATNVAVQVRIISERKYGSFESSSNAQSQQSDNLKKRMQKESSSSKNKSKYDRHSSTVVDQTKKRGYKGGITATPAAAPVSIGVSTEMKKEDQISASNTTSNMNEKENENELIINQQQKDKNSQFMETATNDVSQHHWDKVKVGFTEIMPKQTIVFPVQISDPNAVVYMTIYIPSLAKHICENVQIDANFIKIEKINIDRDVDNIKWKHSIKPPKKPKFQSADHQDDSNENDMLNIKELCRFLRNGNVSDNKIDFVRNVLGDTKYNVNKDEDIKALFDHIKTSNAIYIGINAEKESISKDSNDGLEKLVGKYVNITKQLSGLKKDQTKHNAGKKKQRYEDRDSDDEELHAVAKFFDVDGYSLLKKWKLEQFFERMADEGWQNPLDWIHLDDNIMKQSLGFRHGHIQIFNRKFDLWVKKYNEVRRTIVPKQKGKDGTLIVGPNEVKVLLSNYNYEFTKVIIRENGRLSTKAWSPQFKIGGVLLIKSFQEIVLEKNASITVSGKGYWGAQSKDYKGWGPGAGGSVSIKGCGAGGAGYGTKGKYGHVELQNDKCVLAPSKAPSKAPMEVCALAPMEVCALAPMDGMESTMSMTLLEEHGGSKEKDASYGDGGDCYGDAKLTYLDCKDNDDDFMDSGYAKKTTVARHSKALGSGGGTYNSTDIHKRGGTGGGAMRIICDRLIMYNGSKICANGYFDPAKDPLSSGGSGGSIFITVKSEIWAYNENKKDWSFKIEAIGGGKREMDSYEKWKEKDEEKEKHDDWKHKWKALYGAVGTGGDGRMRIDYHSPYSLQLNKCVPIPTIGVDDGSMENGEQNKQINATMRDASVAALM